MKIPASLIRTQCRTSKSVMWLCSTLTSELLDIEFNIIAKFYSNKSIFKKARAWRNNKVWSKTSITCFNSNKPYLNHLEIFPYKNNHESRNVNNKVMMNTNKKKELQFNIFFQ